MITKGQLRIIMGNNIRKTRVERHIARDELAMLLGLSSGLLGLMERGDRGVSALSVLKLADIFDLSTEHFFRHDRSATFDKHTERRKKLYAFTGNFTDGELDLIIEIAINIHRMRDSNRMDNTD